MSHRLTNIRPGRADVVVDGKAVGWVYRGEVTVSDYEGRLRDVLLWEAAVPHEHGDGLIVTNTAHARRRDAVAELVEYAKGKA